MCGWPVFKCTNHVLSLGYGAEKSGDFLSFSCASWVKLIGQKPYVRRGRAITQMGVASLDNDAKALSRNDVSWTTNLVLVMTKALHCPARPRVLSTQDREQSLSTLRVVASGSDLRRRSTFRCINDSVVATKYFTSADSSKIAPTSPSTIIGFNTHLGLWTVRVFVHTLRGQS